MKRAARREAHLPAVRDAAARVVATCGPTGMRCRAFRLLQYVRQAMRYVPDPREVEAVGLASFHLQNIARQGYTWGDCDDAAVMLATMARAVGLRTRFAVASFLETRALHHVWTEALAGGEFLTLDPFRSERLLRAPSRVLVTACVMVGAPWHRT